MMRAPQRDHNEADLVDALRAAGHLVQQLNQGDGVPDLLVCTPSGRLLLLEVKDGAKKPSAQKLTPDQVRWHQQWARAPLYVVKNIDQALEAIRSHA